MAEFDPRKIWVEIRDPNCVPDLKGPFPPSMIAGFLREAMDGRPYSHLTVITLLGDGVSLEDGPTYLMMMDGRSRSRAMAHIKRTRVVRATPPSSPSTDEAASKTSIP